MNLKELAKLLELSPTTVSRALNGYPEVNANTRERVTAAARKYGYAPNQVAKRLATGRSHTIGHVIPISGHQMINPIFAEFMAGAGEVYSTRSYDSILSVVPETEEADAYRTLVANRKVDGVIVHGPHINDYRIDLLQELGLPFVVHGRDTRPESEYSWLDMNNRRAFLRATDFLLDLGHRRIALLNGIETHNFAARRHQGYQDALTRRGVPYDPALVFAADMVEPLGYDSTRKMLADDNPPTAIITSSIMVALGVLRATGELGLHSGRDISIITHDDDLSYLPNGGAVPLFTATRSSVRGAGRRCAEMLMDIIESADRSPQHELWEADLTVGRSTGPCPEGLKYG